MNEEKPMDPYLLPYAVRDALLCLTFLAGMGAGVLLITRRQTTAGGLALAAFILFSLDPITDIVIFQVMPNVATIDDYTPLNWAYACITGPAILLGVAALIAALIVNTRSQTPESAG